MQGCVVIAAATAITAQHQQLRWCIGGTCLVKGWFFDCDVICASCAWSPNQDPPLPIPPNKRMIWSSHQWRIPWRFLIFDVELGPIKCPQKFHYESRGESYTIYIAIYVLVYRWIILQDPKSVLAHNDLFQTHILYLFFAIQRKHLKYSRSVLRLEGRGHTRLPGGRRVHNSL